MKILFMGTPDFAVFSLRALANSQHEIIGVITQPDKPRGRGYVLAPPPVKEYALSHGYEVYQPATLKDEAFAELLSALNPDIIVVVAYGKILPKNILDYPRFGCINVHGSLLPEYRGAAPMQRAIIDGKGETGITTMYMAEGLDTGDMLLRKKIKIEDNDNFEAIHDKLGECGASLIVETLDRLEDGTLERIPQSEELASYAAKITKEDCAIDFSLPAREVHNLIRGLSPVPLSFTHLPNGKLLKITRAHIAPETGKLGRAGEVISVDGGITVACGEGAVTIDGVLPEGKPRMSAEDFVRGKKISVSELLK